MCLCAVELDGGEQQSSEGEKIVYSIMLNHRSSVTVLLCCVCGPSQMMQAPALQNQETHLL